MKAVRTQDEMSSAPSLLCKTFAGGARREKTPRAYRDDLRSLEESKSERMFLNCNYSI